MLLASTLYLSWSHKLSTFCLYTPSFSPCGRRAEVWFFDQVPLIVAIFLSLVIPYSTLSLLTKDGKLFQAVLLPDQIPGLYCFLCWGRLLPLVDPSSELTMKSPWEPLVCSSKSTSPGRFFSEESIPASDTQLGKSISCNTRKNRAYFLDPNWHYQCNNSVWAESGGDKEEVTQNF